MTAPSNPAEVGALNQRGPDFAFPMEDAPKDGTILRLLVKFDRKSAVGAFEDTTEPSWTIGANNKENTGEDQWDIVGWSWEQDVFCHAYGATAIGWLPFHTESNEPSALALSPPIGDTGSKPVGFINADGGFLLTDTGAEWFKAAVARAPVPVAGSPAFPLYAVDHIADAGKMVPEIIDALIEASNQIEYLHGKFQETGSGNNAVIAKLAEVRRALQANPS